MLVSGIRDGRIRAGSALPSTRKLAETLGVSRNTVVLVYEGLVEDGYLIPRERSGYYVSEDIRAGRAEAAEIAAPAPPPPDDPDWTRRFRIRPTTQENIQKPRGWEAYPYPFIYGQVDLDLFPIGAWRECARQALGKRDMGWWVSDNYADDDPDLVEQIRDSLLPRRGIFVRSDQILVTLGAQNALYLTASLLVTPESTVGFEEPGYPDFRNVFRLRTDRTIRLGVDGRGVCVDERLAACDCVYVTPSHQFPTTVVLPMERREALLASASEHRFLVIEDDYESDANFEERPLPALKSMDAANRVIYVGSLSKSLFPGLRLGFLVGPPQFIAEARALRRLMLRHAPTNSQRTAARFISLGHYDSLIRRLHTHYRRRWEIMRDAMERHLPLFSTSTTFGGTSFWAKGPSGLDTDRLAAAAREKGIIIEPGRVFFDDPKAPANFLRLGFSSIPAERIEPGVRLLAGLVRRQLRDAP